MSKRSNKRAKKLDQDELMGSMVSIDQANQASQLSNDELFTINDRSSKSLSQKQLKKQELTDLLFNKPPPKKIDITRRFPKTAPVMPKSLSFRQKSNRKLQKLNLNDEDAVKEQLQELYKQGIVNKRGQVINYNGDDDDGDVNTDLNDFDRLTAIPIDSYVLQLTEDELANISESDFEEEKDNNDQDDMKETNDIDDGDCSDPEFMADWIKYTGNISKPIKSLREHHKKRFQELRELEEYNNKTTTFSTTVKPTLASIAKSIRTGRHIDHIDLDVGQMEDIWDDSTVQKNAEDSSVAKHEKQKHQKNVGRQNQLQLTTEDELDYAMSIANGLMKNRRSEKSSKHVTTKAFRVAPAGLSINPQTKDMKMLLRTYGRRVKSEKKQKRRLDSALDGSKTYLKRLAPVGKKELARFHKTIWKPVPDGPAPFHIKTRQERNAEKKKAYNRYLHVLEVRKRKFAQSVKKIHLALEAFRKHELYLKNKLPVIRAEAAEVKKDQPVKFGRNYFKPLKPELQTKESLTESQGHLRRSFMSSSLLADSFNALQRTNKIPAIGIGSKKLPKKKVKVKNALAAGVRAKEIDVEAIMQKASERALAHPKPINPTKNKKRKLQPINGSKHNMNDDENNDYGYDSDDDIWG